MTHQRRAGLLLAVLFGTLLGPLDSAVNIAFPDITRSFGIKLESIRWVVIAYVSTYASLMLVFGRIGDLFGHRRVFVFGLVISLMAFTACSLASSFNALLYARIFQGVGNAMVLSCGPALATHLFDEKFRPQVLGAYAMCFGLGGALGPSVGGVLVDHFGWSAAFWSRIPLALGALALAVVLKLPSPARDRGRFGFIGSALLALATALLLFSVSQLDIASDRPLYVAFLFATAVIAIVVILTRSRSPLIDFRLFGRFNFAWINIANVAVNMAGFATMLFVPYFLVRVSGLSLWQSGLYMGLGALGMMVAAHIAGLLLRRQTGVRLALVSGVVVSTSLLWMSFWHQGTGSWALCGGLVLHGIGLGLFQVAALDVVTGSLPRENRGVAGSLALVMRTVGVVLAANILTLYFSSVLEGGQGAAAHGDLALAFQQTFRAASIGLFVFTVVSMCRRSFWKRKPAPDQA